VGEIIKRFEQKGFRLVALKFMQVSGLHSSYCGSFVASGTQ
jgi:nucleoside diphosphate kinase